MPKIYLVGGACRDKLLGRTPKDSDFVVVGADIAWMEARNFKQVGESFPVFLHPESGDEYALARREKKVGAGYKGFEFEFGPHVTLEDDLLRRDLTINSIAMDCETGEVFDPYGGIKDLEDKIIRHTSLAFAEDPLRVLRVARFVARYGFEVADETVELCEHLVSSGEIDALSSNRIWTELEKLFSEKNPSRGLKFLNTVGALDTKSMVPMFRRDLALDYFKNESNLSFDEKVYGFISIEMMSPDEISRSKIPLHHVKVNKFLNEMFSLSEALILGGDITTRVVDFFNRHREEIKKGDLLEMFKSFSRKIDQHDDISRIEKAFNALLELDFTEITRGLKGSEIKKVVMNVQHEVAKIGSFS